jgi:hypothetical protein
VSQEVQGKVTQMALMDEVVGVHSSDLVDFVERWHYSHRMPTGKNICFGWYGAEGLYAAAVYGIGVNPYQAAYLERFGIKVEAQALLELKRLCRVEPKDEGRPLTSFLSQCHKMLKARGCRVVVSFSDPAWGHNGGIYQAANFTHCGQTNGEWHTVDEHGVVRHRRFAFRFARRKGVSIEAAREQLGLKRVHTPPKDRWVIVLRREGQHNHSSGGKK